MNKVLLLALLSFSISAAHPNRPPEQWHEADYVNFNCDGEIEHVLSDRTRVDCLTDEYAIEY